MVLKTASDAAQARGLPPNVDPCIPAVKTSFLIFRFTTKAPMGTPPPNAFESVMMSGSIP
jgi:hypothetical protein